MDGEARIERQQPPGKYGGYTLQHIERLFSLAEKGFIDVLNLDLGIVGFTRWRRIMPELQAMDIMASPHTWRWCARPYYTAHLASGVGNIITIEGIPGETSHLNYSSYRLENGELHLPSLPGFGIAFNPL